MNPDPELPSKLIQHVLGSIEEHVKNSDSGPEDSLVPRPEEEEKGPGFSRSRMCLIISNLSTC